MGKRFIGDEKRRFKLYKSGKKWLVAGISSLALVGAIGIVSQAQPVHATETTATTTATDAETYTFSFTGTTSATVSGGFVKPTITAYQDGVADATLTALINNNSNMYWFDWYSADGSTLESPLFFPSTAGTYTIKLNSAGVSWINSQLAAKGSTQVITADDVTTTAGNYIIAGQSFDPTDPRVATTLGDSNSPHTYGDKDANHAINLISGTKWGTLLTGHPDNAALLAGITFTSTTDPTKVYNGVMPTDAGTYTMSLTDTGLAAIQAVNPNYQLELADFSDGTLVINPASVTTTISSPNVSFNYNKSNASSATVAVTLTGSDGTTKTVDLTGDQLNVTNDDSAAGSYAYTISSTGWAYLQTQMGSNYTVTADDTLGGTITVTAPASYKVNATPVEQTWSQTMSLEPNTVTAYDQDGNLLDLSQDITYNDVDWYNADGTTEYSGYQLGVGTYTLRINASGLAKLNTAYPGLNITAADFADVLGNYIIIQAQLDPDTEQKVTRQIQDITITYNTAYTKDVRDVNGDWIKVDAPLNISSDTIFDYNQNLDPTDYYYVEYANITANDFQYTNTVTGEVFNADGTSDYPTEVGTYTISLNATGLSDLQSWNPNWLVTTAQYPAGTLTIEAQAATATIATPDVSFDYSGNNGAGDGNGAKASTASITVTLTATDGTTKDVTLTGDELAVVDDAAAAGTYNYTISATGWAALQAALGTDYTVTEDDTLGGTITINKIAATQDKTLVFYAQSYVPYGTKVNFELNRGAGSLIVNDVVVRGGNGSGTVILASDLTNADFIITDTKGNVVTVTYDADGNATAFTYTDGTSTPYLRVGTYTLSLTADGLAKLNAANPNFIITNADIAQGSPSSGATYALGILANNHTVGELSDLTYTYDGTHTASEFAQADAAAAIKAKLSSWAWVITDTSTTKDTTTLVDGLDIPADDIVVSKDSTNAGSYTYSLNDAGMGLVQAAIGSNYSIKAADVTGTITILTAAATTSTVNDLTTHIEDGMPDFTVAYGDGLNTATLTNDDFIVTDSKGNVISGMPTALGEYTVTLSAAGQAKIEAANPNYTFATDGSDFVAGTWTVRTEATTITLGDTTIQFTQGMAYPPVTSGNSLVTIPGLDANDYTFYYPTAGAIMNGLAVPGGEVAWYYPVYVLLSNDGTNTPVAYISSLSASGLAKLKAANPYVDWDDLQIVEGASLVLPLDIDDERVQATVNDEGLTYDQLTGNNLAQYVTPTYPDQTNLIIHRDGADPADTTNYLQLDYTDFTFTSTTDSSVVYDGVLPNVGEYNVTLNAKGLAALQAFNTNQNFVLTLADIHAGVWTITAAAPSVTVNDATINYGDATPDFTVTNGTTTQGDGLTTTALTNDDFQFVDQAGNVSTTAPTAAGTYTVALTAAAKAAIEAANPYYTFTDSDFIAGTFTIDPIAANTTTVNDATIDYGQSTPIFSAEFGTDLTGVTLTNNDFQFVDAAGNVSATAPTNAGTYTVELTDAAKATIEAANPNYSFTDSSFAAGTYTINKVAAPVTTVGDETINYGQATPGFAINYGTGLTGAKLTNDALQFTDAKGNTTTTAPTAAGTYTVSLTDAAKAAIEAANATNYTFGADSFKTGTFTIKKVAASDVAVNNATINFGDSTPSFGATFGTGLTAVTLTNSDFQFVDEAGNVTTTAPTAAGTYTVELTDAAKAKIEAANDGNYTFTAANFVAGTFTINKITASNVTVNNATINYGDATPSFSATFGTGLTAVTLTNSDFQFVGANGNVTTTAPTAAGTYTVELTAAAKAKIEAANDANYTFSDANFSAGTFTIAPIAAPVTTVNNAAITQGAKTPTFGITLGAGLSNVTLTNSDFQFVDANGKVSATAPTAVGTHTIELTAAAQARLAAANPNYTFTASSFVAGTFTITKQETNNNGGSGNGGSNNNGGSTNGSGNNGGAAMPQTGGTTTDNSGTGDGSTALPETGQRNATLPQTGDNDNRAFLALGAAILMMTMGMAVTKRRREN